MYEEASLLGGSFDPHEFNETMWGDPRISGRMDPRMMAAASGLVAGAAISQARATASS